MTTNTVCQFIGSLKGRKSHYSLKDSQKIYLPEDLNIKKLHRLYLEKHAEYTLSYESFRQIFENKFNISFGYPRKDTCSFCDKIAVEISALQNDLSATIPSVQDNASIMQKIKAKELEKTLHLKKAEEFYKIKRKFRKLAKKEVNFEAVAMDFQRNLPVPNITTNDAYYRRQLNFMSFNIHVLSDSSSVFYTYDETEGKKGADDVCSMLNHFVSTVLSKDVRNLVIFCDLLWAK
ncbi:uncharacterized protein LOC106673655 [Cimex lectularius]|uniref:Uncharacterized protein n=1 Tax=Cimex lectularius TaxID=79782 RepID=A0A8I6SCN0_CIMLE|nr:uncharacterized protein LOC106673655 [Cimex lectularius]